MTKEITKAFILQQIQDKLKLRELEPERFSFSETVVPTYNIESHLLDPEIIANTVAVGSLGEKLFFTVPQTERWTLHGYNIIFVTGVYEVTGLVIGRTEIIDYFYVDMLLGHTVSYAVNLPKDIVLDPNDKIFVYVDSYTSTGDLVLRCDVTKETLR